MNKRAIGFIGLGNLGIPLVNNLLHNGYIVHLYNRTASKILPFEEKGAIRQKSIPSLAAACSLIISLVSNDAALAAITKGEEGLAKHMQAGAIHISMSTVSPEIADELSLLHEQHHSIYLAAPIMGRPEAATARKIGICVAGDAEARDKVKKIWAALGAAWVRDFGERPGAANTVKLGVNFMLASMVETMTEAFTLMEKNGVKEVEFYEMITSQLFNCAVYKNYGKILLEKQFTPVSFSLKLGQKDIGLVLAAAARQSVNMPMALVVKERLDKSVAKGRGEMDFAALSMITGEESERPG